MIISKKENLVVLDDQHFETRNPYETCGKNVKVSDNNTFLGLRLNDKAVDSMMKDFSDFSKPMTVRLTLPELL